MEEVLEQLAKLKEKYQDRQVSVLVGAGFSKNACKDYPSWDDLLEDMAVELYKDEIEKAFLHYKELNPTSKVSLDVFTKPEAKRVIAKVGYLKMVSEYIKRKGFRESIEHYIEERVPYIDEERQEFHFAGKNIDKVIPVNKEQFKTHVRLLSCENWVRIYTTNYDRLLEYAKKIGTKEYTIITKARELSDNSGPAIIKLHGNLYHPSEKPRKFIFDGNPHQQYIISEEDYRNYPKDHEAFTQLMRISLLQGVFCLIGFSGDDPNFINWISWVRDVLVTDEDTENKGDRKYKIFLIGMSKDLPDAAKQIFYENHNIFYIPFLSEEVKGVLGATDSDDSKALFCKFFDYLDKKGQNEKDVMPVEPDSEEQKGSREYNRLWGTVYERKVAAKFPQVFPKTSMTVNDDVIEQLWSLKNWNRFVVNPYYQKNYLHEITFKDELSESEARLALIAIRDSGCFINEKLRKQIEKSDISDELKSAFQKYIQRSETLCLVDTDDEDDTVEGYEAILRQLILLRFGKAKQLLTAWEPEGVDILKKVVLQYFFHDEGWRTLLSAYIETEIKPKELYYAARLKNVLENHWMSDASLARFENANIQDYLKLLSDLVKQVTEHKEKIGKYGDGKNVKTIYFGTKPNKKAEALTVLNFLIEAPLMVSFREFYVMISPENWYKVHQQLFEMFPLPILFYGLQGTDKKVRTRIGQDYAYSDDLAANYLDKLLNHLLKALLSDSTPAYLNEAILGISMEMFVSVKPEKWEPLFIRVWEEIVCQYRFVKDNERRFEELDAFVNKALNSLSNKQIRQRVILDVLKNVKADSSFSINCLYYLHVIPTDGKDNEMLTTSIDQFVDGISDPYEVNVAGNIYRILTKEQRDRVAEKCVELLKKERIPNLVYQTTQFFVKDDAKKRQLFIKSVCDNPLLWANGIMADGTGMTDFEYLKLSGFTKRIRFDRASVEDIYGKMKKSADQLLGFVDIHDRMPFLSDVDGLLSEMVTFMNTFKTTLVKQQDYNEVYNKISKAFYEISGFESIETGLLSEYEEELKNSLEFIYSNRGVLSHKKLLDYTNIIVNRVLLRNSDGLDTCIAYLNIFLSQGIITTNDEDAIKGFVRVLDRYKKEDIQQCNMDLVMAARCLAKIAKSLAKEGISSKGIEYWMTFEKSSRFYCNFN